MMKMLFVRPIESGCSPFLDHLGFFRWIRRRLRLRPNRLQAEGEPGLEPAFDGTAGRESALSGSLLRIPFGAMVDRTGGKKPILILLVA